MGLKQILGGPTAAPGETFAAGTSMTATVVDAYRDGSVVYLPGMTLRYEYDVANARWKPQGAADGTLAYIVGSGNAEPYPPRLLFRESHLYVSGRRAVQTDELRVFETATGVWDYRAIPIGTPLTGPLSVAGVNAINGRAGAVTLSIADLNATGTRDATTVLHGDGTWKAPGASGGSSYVEVPNNITGDGSTNVSSAFQTFLNDNAGKSIAIRKTYALRSVTVPANTTLVGFDGGGFKLNTQSTTGASVLIVSSGVRLESLTLDGSRASMTAASATYGDALVRGLSVSDVRVVGCVVRNSYQLGLYFKESHRVTVMQNLVTNCRLEAIFFHGGRTTANGRTNNVVTNNIIHTTTLDAIKVHGDEGTNAALLQDGVTISDNVIDYGASNAVGANVLAIEVFGGTAGGVCRNVTVSGNVLTGFADWATNTSTTTFGISIDKSNGVTVTGNTVRQFTYGLEAAGSQNVAYTGNSVFSYRISAVSLSQASTRDITITGNTFNNAARATWTGVFAVQLVNATNCALTITGNHFVDAGQRAVFLNNAGNGSIITGNRMLVDSHNHIASNWISPVYLLGVSDVRVANNVIGFQAGGTGTADLLGVEFNSPGNRITVENNTVSGLKGDGTTKAASSPLTVGGGANGDHIIRGNRFENFTTAPFLGTTGNPNTITDNLFIGTPLPSSARMTVDTWSRTGDTRRAVMTADVATTSNASLSSLTDLSMRLETGGTYLLEYTLLYSTAATTTGTYWQFYNGSGTISAIQGAGEIFGVGGAGTAAVYTSPITSTGSVVNTAGVNAANTVYLARFTVLVTVSAAGTIHLGVRSTVSGSEVRVRAGSSVTARLVTA